LGVVPLEADAGPVASGAGGAGARPTRRQLRLVAWVAGGVAILGAVALTAWQLAAARVPQHRAALEALIREHTGLEVGFRELSVRWGWYGPEAVFHRVVLGEPGGGGALLRAPTLIVGLDTWRMLRSGELAIARITLVEPDIDFGAGAAARAGAHRPQAGHDSVVSAGARLLSRWRGGRIELEGGALHWPLPGAMPLTVSVRHAQLRRLADVWDADVQLLLPARLGESLHLSVQMRGDPAQPHELSGGLSFDGRRLEFAGWREVIRYPPTERYLPEGGLGNLELHAEFADGRLLRVDGKVLAEGLAWRPPAAAAGVLGIERLRGDWQLVRRGEAWRLEAHALESDAPAPSTVSASVDVASDAGTAQGHIESAPLALLAAVARSYAPQLPLAQVSLDGVVRELSFDWNAHRPAGERLRTSARLEELTIGSASRELTLRGLSAQLSGVDARLTADLHGEHAQLHARLDEPVALEGLAVAARLALAAEHGGWQLRTDELAITRADLALAASGALTADGAGGKPQVAAHIALKQADAVLIAKLLGPRALAALGAASAMQLAGGRIENADLEWRGPIDPRDTGSGFRGAFELRDASLGGFDPWPDLEHLDAHLEWRGPRVHAAVVAGEAGTFKLAGASADWDVRGKRPTHLAARLTASAQPALAWLRAHPQLASYAPGMEDVDLRGETRLDVDVLVPAPAAGVTPGTRRAPPPRTRINAVLDDVQLRAVAGLPPIDGLHGTLGFTAGHLQPSQLSGQWLGGPVTLNVAERRDAVGTALAISGRGLAKARDALLAAGASDDAMLEGSAEWTALLTLLPGPAGSPPRWRVRADSNLIGVTSRLPEPFAKAESLSLPLRVEMQAGADAGQLRLALGERLRAAAALNRSGELWRIERGAVRLASTAPALPEEPVLLLEGRMNRLDLPPLLALWRQAGRDPALPALRAHLSAAQLVVGERTYGEASVSAEAALKGGTLELESEDLTGTASWSATVDEAHPARVHLSRMDAAQLADAALGAGLAAALGPAARLSIDALEWQGRSLGSLGAELTSRADGFDVGELRLTGETEDSRGSVHCQDGACRAQFGLDSRDAAATLTAYGFRPELAASHALLTGELQWPQAAGPSLATLAGRLHMQLEQGVTRTAREAGGGVPLALLSVPALTAGLHALNGEGVLPGLNFSRLTADFELRDGQATTSDLHFDGDAEILVRGRTGLLAHDYDEQAWILRGEQRLPAAVRRLGPTPKVAAVWLSLRELFAGSADRTRAALRLRGTWEEPMVTSAD
jgi:uncharacterized protein YhdP